MGYHEYVIKDGKFVGKFEEMYRNCEQPWPETEEDLDNNPISSYALAVIRRNGFKKIFSCGSGKGLHANWLKKRIPGASVEGCEVSQTAVDHSLRHYPDIPVTCMDVRSFVEHKFDFDVIIFREILWYILPHWAGLVETLKKNYAGKHVIIEITCYDDQGYGREFFDGPEDIIKKFPFQFKEVLRHHVTASQREGMVLIFGQI